MNWNFTSPTLLSLSLEVGRGVYTLDDCRRMVRAKASLIEDDLSAVFNPISRKVDARAAFAVLDNSKALLARRISLQRQWDALGAPIPDMIVGLMSSDGDIDTYLQARPGVAACSLYLATDGRVWAVFARAARWRRAIQYDVIGVVSGTAAAEFLREANQYLKSLVSGLPDFALQTSLLRKLGAAILPAIQKLRIRGSLVLIPHRLLHLLPLHCMSADINGRCTYLDQLVQSTSYAASLFQSRSPRIVAGRAGFAHKPARVLAVFDTSAADLKWIQPQVLYYRGLQRMGLPIDIVLDDRHLPSELSEYIWISWGGHATSSPADWGGSSLAFGRTKHRAIEIALRWTCARRPWILLGACSSAVDTSEIQHVDEYCGLDLAFVMGGAWGVTATMWPVADELAAFADTFLTDHVFFHRRDPAEAQAVMQRSLRTGTWKRLMSPTDSRHGEEIRAVVRELQRLPDDAFSAIRDWGVFRSYGAP